jgi:hypothetical protein
LQRYKANNTSADNSLSPTKG